MSAVPETPASALSEEAIRADERERVAALLTDNAGVFDGYGTAEAMRKALVVMLTLPFGNAKSSLREVAGFTDPEDIDELTPVTWHPVDEEADTW